MQFANNVSNKKSHKPVMVMLSIILVIITIITMLSGMFHTNAATAVKPRFQIPYAGESGYDYYYSDKNIFYRCGYGMPNCTAYAYGRAYEMLGYEPNLCTSDAKYWYDYNKSKGYYDYGQTPKVGAIACWSSSSGGHVAVVEAIDTAKNKIIMSQSAYQYLEFYLSYEDIDNPGQSGWTFQGYIYPGDFTSTGFSGDLYRSVDYTGSINFRSGPGTDYSVLSTIDYHMGFVVTDRTSRDGYTWGKTTYKGQDGYIALTSDTQLLLSGSSPTPPEPEPEPITVKEYYIVTSDDGINLRSSYSTSSSKVGFLPYDAQLLITKKISSGDYTWGYTEYGGKSGWFVLNYAERIFGGGDGTKVTVYKSNTGIRGDVDGDGYLTISDATAIQMYVTDMAMFTQGAWDCANVTGSGSISISDVTAIQVALATGKSL